MAELNGLRNQFYELRSELQSLQGNIGRLEQYIRDAESRLTTSVDKTKQLEIKKYVFMYLLYFTYVADKYIRSSPGICRLDIVDQ